MNRLTGSNSDLRSLNKKIESGQKSSFNMICDGVILVVIDLSFEHVMKRRDLAWAKEEM